MVTTIGYIFLGLAALVFLAMFNMMFLQSIPRGDAGVGYAWMLLFGVGAFSICVIIVAAVIGLQGGFAWVGSPRTVLVVAGLFLILLGNGFFVLMASEHSSNLPPFIRQFFRYIPAVLPPLLLMAAGILLHEGHKGLTAITYLPIGLGLASGIGALAFILVYNAQNASAKMQSELAFQDKIYQDHLDDIDGIDPEKDLVFLFVFTDANQAPAVREQALAKIKTRADWQVEVLRCLQNDWAPEAFTFLASNEVDDPARFAEPLRLGILIQARLIREHIRRCQSHYDLYSGRFTWEVERVLRTVDKFQGFGTDYRPAVQELLYALDEPTDFEKPKLQARGLLNKWLKKH